MHPPPIYPNQQRGVALLTALIFLVILTMLGLSIVGSTTAEEKVARNTRDVDIAFAAAEAALRDAELRLTGAYQWPYNALKVTDFDIACTNGLCDSSLTPIFQSVNDIDFYTKTGLGANSQKIGTITGTALVSGLKDDVDQSKSSQPRYMIEKVCTTLGSRQGFCNMPAFRITAKSRGRLPNTLVVLQEVYLPADFGN